MRFFSDNAAPVHDRVLDAIAAANRVDTAYDGDALSRRLDARFAELFEREVTVLWIATGTAANSLALASMVAPHQAVICHEEAHIQNDECGAPEFYTHGAKLFLGTGEGAKLSPDSLLHILDGTRRDVHQTQPAAISLTNATEYGRVYSAAETGALGEIAKARGLGFHVDGARFANAVVQLGCTPAELTWKAGVDVLSFGFVKNGGLNAEALVFFKQELAAATLYRRKRAGHLLSKGRYMAAQILALLDDDLWLANARASNGGAARIAAAAGDRLVHQVEANEIFLRLSAAEAAALRAQGLDFYDWGAGQARFVISWNQADAEIAALAEALAAL